LITAASTSYRRKLLHTVAGRTSVRWITFPRVYVAGLALHSKEVLLTCNKRDLRETMVGYQVQAVNHRIAAIRRPYKIENPLLISQTHKQALLVQTAGTSQQFM
jgi:hypothetical protein